MRSAEGRGARNGDGDLGAHAPAPMLVGLISPDFLYQKNQSDRAESIESEDAVIIVNPV